MNIISLVESEEDKKRVEELAERLDLNIVYEEAQQGEETLALRFDANGLALVDGSLEMYGDFTSMIPRLKENNLNGEQLVRAAKIKNARNTPIAFDATAGMGEDSLLLAASGYQVHLCEYNPIIAALLEDTLRRAADIPELSEIVGRMHLTAGNSVEIMRSLPEEPDLILLDPMFPARKKSGLVKKKFQLLQQLEQPCTDEKELMQAAMDAHPHRIVVKRPAKGPHLAGVKPSYAIDGKGIRYDCIVLS